ncbi:LppU/SCO3897 family protein, partial [Planosporangium flavigriseum]
YHPGQQYGQQYGQPTQAFNPNQQYGQPSEDYQPQSPAGYPAPPFQPQREMPTNVYGTPSGPPAPGYDLQGQAPQGYSDPASGGDDEFAPEGEGKKKRLLLILALVAAVVVLAAVGTVVTLVMRGSNANFAINDCVKQSDSKAVKATCSDSGAYKVVKKVKKQEDCSDPNQPFVIISNKGGSDDVLCLRPANQQ